MIKTPVEHEGDRPDTQLSAILACQANARGYQTWYVYLLA